jgi:plasmid stabilization system protein ParE
VLEHWGPKQEKAYLDRMWNRFREIQSRPGTFRARPDLFPGCQIATEGKHENVTDRQVLHTAMDYKRHL